MNLLRLFFSFHGRVNRAGFWIVSLVWFVLGSALDTIWSASGAADVPVGRNHLVDAAFFLLVAPPLASCLAVIVTRLHDRNKSAWWIVVFVICPPLIETLASLRDLDAGPMVGLMFLSGAISIWALVDLGCLRGTVGPNRYGPDPLAGVAEPQRKDDVAIGRF